MKTRLPYRSLGLIAILIAGGTPAILAGPTGRYWVDNNAAHKKKFSAKLGDWGILFTRKIQSTGYLLEGRVPLVQIYREEHPESFAPAMAPAKADNAYDGMPTLTGFMDHLETVKELAAKEAEEKAMEDSAIAETSTSADDAPAEPDDSKDATNSETDGSEIVLQTTSPGMLNDGEPLFKRPQQIERLQDRFFLYFPITELSHDEVIIGQGAYNSIFIPPAQQPMRSSATLREQQ